ncbi:Late embryogenesis abundant protein [Quillaja saponaria]|uniref:Late embryogenesis abundant protein n=1 Tax=Quillaja saponaria TaxID=32244 RepID=A0AAD7P7Y1_QUISA|nr:Late embryogenesis abundant protein [Quillaja saponaria]
MNLHCGYHPSISHPAMKPTSFKSQKTKFTEFRRRKTACTCNNTANRQTKKTLAGFPNAFATSVSPVVAFIVVLCITLAALHFALKPKPPTFSVANLVVKNVTKSSGRKSNYSQLQYQVTLTAKNPNAKMGINYEKDGQASLAYKDKNVADGDFPTLYQEQDMSKKVKISLVGSNKALPGEMDKSMNHKNSNIPISLDLNMKVPVSMKFGVMSWGMEVEVECVIKLNTLKAGAKVLSQECT